MGNEKDHKAQEDRIEKAEKTLKALLLDSASAAKVGVGLGKLEKRVEALEAIAVARTSEPRRTLRVPPT